MAKKAVPSKKISRSSSMEKTLEDAQAFLNAGKSKKITKARTMVRTIQEAKGPVILAPRRNARKDHPAPPKKAPKAKCSPAEPCVALPAIPSLPSASLALAGKKASLSKIQPATIFRGASRDNLPLPAFGFVDVCFCIDSTGSMSSELEQCKSVITTIIKRIESKVRTEGITLRFAIVSYRDHPPQDNSYVTQFQDFGGADYALAYLNTLQAGGGGDEPEAAHDGLLDSCEKLSWVNLAGTPMLRYIFHIADAPPHGSEFLTGEGRLGCLCGKTTDQVAHAINIRQIHYRLIKARVNPKLEEMEKIFKKKIVDFGSTQISVAHEMDIKVSDMIIHQMLVQ